MKPHWLTISDTVSHDSTWASTSNNDSIMWLYSIDTVSTTIEPPKVKISWQESTNGHLTADLTWAAWVFLAISIIVLCVTLAHTKGETIEREEE